MKTETKNCQNCKKDFVIEQEDFNFYEKIKVPPPTFCPECRMIRRMIWRNMRALYERKCGLCKKFLVSMYSDDIPVYCNDCWYGGNWDPQKYNKEYDFSKLFFIQLKELFQTVPRLFRFAYGNQINSDFSNYSKDNKNVYLSYSVTDCEDIMYSQNVTDSRDSFDSFGIIKTDKCSYNVECERNYNTHWAVQSNNCIDSHFIYDCVNCQNCCLSSNLRNKKYYFKNQKLSKEDYEKTLEELKLDRYSGVEKAISIFDKEIVMDAIHKFAQIYASHNVTGDYIHNSKSIKYCFDIINSENIAYSQRVLNAKDYYDNQGSFGAELCYESVAASINSYKNFFTYLDIIGCRECEYSFILKNCSNCFGCVGMTNAKFCIFNKQYEEKEYFEMVGKIKKHMDDMPYTDEKGRIYKYGEFFPYNMCPFGYNETDAHDFFNIKKEEAIKKGYPWKEREKRNYKVTIKSSELPDSILDVSDDIVDEVISCPNDGDQAFQCSSAYRIMPNELQFYKQKKLSLPRYCPNCRHYKRLKYRNPMKLWHRTCMCDKKNHHNHKGKCEVEFETSYAPDRPEIIYCEKCYQQEVY